MLKKSALLVATLLTILVVCLDSIIVFSREHVILSYVRIDIIHKNGKSITKWIKAEEGSVRISIPQGSKHLFLTLDQATPLAFFSITDPSGVDITQDMKYYGVGYVTPKYAFINLTKARLDEVTLKIVKSRGLPLIYEVKRHGSASLGEIAIPPRSSKEFSVDVTNCIGVVLNLVMLSKSRIFLNCSSVNLVNFELKTLEIPGIGVRSVKLLKYIIFDNDIEIVNIGSDDVIALMNITPILIASIDYRIYEGFISINNSSTGTVMLNLPDFVELVNVINGSMKKYDPVFNKPLPPKLYMICSKQKSLEVKIRLKEILFLVNDIENKPVQKATLRLVYPNGRIEYVECKRQVSVSPRLVPYILIDVYVEGFKLSSFNVTGFPSKITLRSQISPLIVYCVDDKGEPLSNAQVQLFSYLSYKLLTEISDEEGKVVFRDVPLHCNYTLIVNFQGQEVSRLTFQLETREVKVISCDVGRVNLVVCDQKNRRIGCMTLEIISNRAKVIKLLVNEKGETASLLLPFSVYRVRISSHSLCLYDGELKVYKSGTYVITVKSYKLVVKVKDVLGTPLSNAKVALMLTKTNEEVDAKFTDQNGVVMFYNLPRGNYAIRVKLENIEDSVNLELEEDTYIEVKLLVIRITETIHLSLEVAIIIVSIIAFSLTITIIKVKKRNIVVIE